MRRIAFDTFSIVAPRGWEKITAAVESDEPLFTLARGDGFGALQFSIALYESGLVPDPSPNDLAEMVTTFAEARGLGAPCRVAVEPGPPRLAAGSFAWGESFLRVWQVSDGRNFAFITFTCESGREVRELRECERIVRTIEFRPPSGAA